MTLKEKNVKEVARFAMVGVLATAIHYGLYYVLLGLMGHNLAYTAGYVVSFVANFFLSSLFTFRVRPSMQRLAAFSTSHLLNYLIGLCLLNVMLFVGVPARWAPLPVFVLVVPVNFLLVRFALKRESKAGDGYRLFLLLAGLAMMWLCLLDAPTLSDDMLYRFMFQADEQAPVRAVTSLSDLLQSQWVHNLTINGRLVVHLLAQGFLAVVPAGQAQTVLLALLNGVLLALLVALSVRWVLAGRRRSTGELFVGAMMCLLLVVVVKDVRTTLLWSLGAFNYLWVLVATMAYWAYKPNRPNKPYKPNRPYKPYRPYRPYRPYKPNRPHGKYRLALLVVALLVGWSHEGLSVPLSAAMVVYLWDHRRSLRGDALVPYMLAYMLGTLCIMLSPALWGRASEGITLMGRAMSGAINLLFNVRVCWLLLVLLLVLWRRNRPLLRAELRRRRYAYVALLVSLAIVVLCGTNLERVPFFADFIALLLLLSLLAQVVSPLWQRRLAAAACLLLLLLYVPIVLVRQENRDVWLDMERQMATTGQELVAVPAGRLGDGCVARFLRSRYVNPTAEFGFYCVYQAFDASDINMRCAAALYGKQHLFFLPQDVVERIETDSAAYAHYELDRDEKLYVWRLPDGRPVSRVTFLLHDEDPSTLGPLQRLTAYQGDRYDLDDFLFEVVTVCGRNYLVFTRPTTNIYRRISNIEYE